MSTRLYSGSIYAFMNWGTMQVIDDANGVVTPGNPVIVYYAHFDYPNNQNSRNNQLWKATASANYPGYFYLVNVESSMALDLNTSQSPAAVVTSTPAGAAANGSGADITSQLWQFVAGKALGPTPNGGLQNYNKTSTLFITTPNGSSSNGTRLQGLALDSTNTAWQSFVALPIVPAGSTVSP